MPQIHVSDDDYARYRREAAELGITVEELVKRAMDEAVPEDPDSR